MEVLPNRTFRIELSNGHRLLAFWPKRWRDQAPALALGQKVTVEVSPYDMSTGRLAAAHS